MIADMHRLERAARLAMGDFDAMPQPAAPPRTPSYLPWRLATLLAILAALAVVAALFG